MEFPPTYVPDPPGPDCQYRRYIKMDEKTDETGEKPVGVIYDYRVGYEPFIMLNKTEPTNREPKNYYTTFSYTLYALSVLMQCCTCYVGYGNPNLVAVLSQTKIVTVFFAGYLITTVVLIGDVDLRCQRTFPLNYILWFLNSVCMSVITCHIAIKLNSYLVLCMLLIVLVVTVINAVYGMFNC